MFDYKIFRIGHLSRAQSKGRKSDPKTTMYFVAGVTITKTKKTETTTTTKRVKTTTSIQSSLERKQEQHQQPAI